MREQNIRAPNSSFKKPLNAVAVAEFKKQTKVQPCFKRLSVEVISNVETGEKYYHNHYDWQ